MLSGLCYNQNMLDERRNDRLGNLPDADRLSALAATILLAYALGHFVDLPVQQFGIQLPGFYLAFPLSAGGITALLVAGLTAAGMGWLLQQHPVLTQKHADRQDGGGKHRVLEHMLLPGLTAWGIGLPLSQIPFSPIWWVGFTLGGGLIMLVLIAEYIVFDPDDARYGLAAAGLTVLSFVLYLVLAAALRFAEMRLTQVLPVLALAALLVSLRTLHLRFHGWWAYEQAGLVALICVQFASALHYWPISPVTFGLILLGPIYALTNLLGNLEDDEPFPRAMIEPAVLLGVIWGIAVFIR